MLTAHDIVVFQGDSITDAGRNREFAANPEIRHHPPTLGFGYAGKVASRLVADLPGIGCYNRGISGNQVTDLAARWQEDALDLKPTLVSILIGVNDTWHGTAKGTPENGTSLEEYDLVYRKLLDDTKAALPEVKLVICEPFTTQAGEVLARPFHPEIDERRGLAKQIASDYEAVWVPFHDMFESLSQKAQANHWAFDGVHPTAAGHQVMADLWLAKVMG